MKKQEFLEKHNNAPYELYEVAELLTTVTDDEDVANTAKAFLEAKANLEMVLDDIGFDFG